LFDTAQERVQSLPIFLRNHPSGNEVREFIECGQVRRRSHRYASAREDNQAPVALRGDKRLRKVNVLIDPHQQTRKSGLPQPACANTSRGILG
jgi:hypothetical protein